MRTEELTNTDMGFHLGEGGGGGRGGNCPLDILCPPSLLSAIKDSFQKLSLIRSKIFENAVSRTHYEIKTRNFIRSDISLSLVCTKSFEVM